jgi:hypothetical protein
MDGPDKPLRKHSRGVLWYPPLQRRCAATAAQSAVVKGLPLWAPLFGELLFFYMASGHHDAQLFLGGIW